MENAMKITVTFDSQGGTPFDSEEFVVGEEYTLPLPEFGLGADLRDYYVGKMFAGDKYALQQPRYAPYAFGGWFTKAGGTGRRVKPRGIWKIPSDVTLYAYWLGTRGLAYRHHTVRKLRVAGNHGDNGDVAIQPYVKGSDTKKIGPYAFAGCVGIKSITVPETVTRIEKRAFRNCIRLSSISVPGTVTSIGSGAFALCISLTDIAVPDGLRFIAPDCFVGCSYLSSLSVPDSVMSIGDRAFASCTRLSSITIPDSVMNIGSHAFARCDSLTDIRYNGTRAQWDAVKKNPSWNDKTPATAVHCQDGDAPF